MNVGDRVRVKTTDELNNMTGRIVEIVADVVLAYDVQLDLLGPIWITPFSQHELELI